MTPAVKACGKCGEVKPLDAFSKNRGRKYGRESSCRDCRKRSRQENREVLASRSRQYREQNREATNEQKRRSYRENRGERLAAARRYREENREAIRERARARYRENREAINDKAWRHRLENGQAIRERDRAKYREDGEGKRAASSRRRARLAGAPSTVTGEDRAALFAETDGRCAVCSDTATDLDHVIPLHHGGWDVPDNLTPLCGSCNRSKGATILVDAWLVRRREQLGNCSPLPR